MIRRLLRMNAVNASSWACSLFVLQALYLTHMKVNAFIFSYILILLRCSFLLTFQWLNDDKSPALKMIFCFPNDFSFSSYRGGPDRFLTMNVVTFKGCRAWKWSRQNVPLPICLPLCHSVQKFLFLLKTGTWKCRYSMEIQRANQIKAFKVLKLVARKLYKRYEMLCGQH